jgi:hypothetical protein
MKRLDMDKVNNGVVCQFDAEPNSDGSIPWVKLAHNGTANRRFQSRYEAITKPYRRKLQIGAMKEEEAQALLRKAMVEVCILDWGNIQPDDDGNNIPFSPGAAEDILGNPEFAHFWAWVQAEADNIENYRKERQEQEGKN